MMGSENDEDSHLHASKEEMESLFLRDGNGSHNLSPPPIIVTPADSDPLSLPPNGGTSYIEPPSYADVVFSPFDDSDDSSDTLSRSPSSSSSSDYIKITVSSPQKEQEAASSMLSGGSTYVTYLITTRTNLPEYKGSDFTVRRRFRDVVALADRLAESYKGFCIPPRPDKSVVESQVMQRQEFVEQRRVALEKYLRRLAAHPVIRCSDELKVFLQVEGKLPLTLQMGTGVASRVLDGGVSVVEVAQPARSGRDLFRLFKELRQSVSNDWGGAKPAVVEEDKEFLEKKEKMHDLEKEIINASQQVEGSYLFNFVLLHRLSFSMVFCRLRHLSRRSKTWGRRWGSWD